MSGMDAFAVVLLIVAVPIFFVGAFALMLWINRRVNRAINEWDIEATFNKIAGWCARMWAKKGGE